MPKGMPWKPILILAACRFCEPVSFANIFPYLFYMIKDLGVDEKDVGWYAGLVVSSFPFAEFVTSIYWGKLSDRIGRKKVIILCLGLCILPTLWFGFATSVTAAIIARTIIGLSNGNAAVARTMVAEQVTVKEQQARAFSIMPIVWSIGCFFAASMGGVLYDPATQYNWNSDFFKKWKWALPNLLSASLYLISLTAAWLFVEETMESLRDEPDLGIKLGNMLLRRKPRVHHHRHSRSVSDAETLLGSPINRTFKDSDTTISPFNLQVKLVIAVMSSVALHTMAFEQSFPLLLSTAVDQGGLGFTPEKVGWMLSATAVVGTVLQIWIFPIIQRWIGNTACVNLSIVLFAVSYMGSPLLAFFSSQPENIKFALSFGVISIQRIGGTLFFPCCMVLLTNAVRSKSVLGVVNGTQQAFTALGRGLGPLGSGPLFALGLRWNKGWLVWTVMTFFCVLSLVLMGLLESEHHDSQKGFIAQEEEEELLDGVNRKSNVTLADFHLGEEEEEDEVLVHNDAEIQENASDELKLVNQDQLRDDEKSDEYGNEVGDGKRNEIEE